MMLFRLLMNLMELRLKIVHLPMWMWQLFSWTPLMEKEINDTPKSSFPDPSPLISLTDPNPNSNPLLSFHIPSSSYGFHAAFPNASDSDEKLEVAWTKDTYDLNGSLRDSHINRPVGVCDDVSYTSAAAMGDVTVNGDEKDQAVDPHGG